MGTMLDGINSRWLGMRLARLMDSAGKAEKYASDPEGFDSMPRDAVLFRLREMDAIFDDICFREEDRFDPAWADGISRKMAKAIDGDDVASLWSFATKTCPDIAAHVWEIVKADHNVAKFYAEELQAIEKAEAKRMERFLKNGPKAAGPR